MNELSILNEFIIELFNDNVLVNTISIVQTNTIDNNKENIYPLVNVDMLSSSVEDQVIIVDYLITIVQQRDIRPKLLDTKLLDDTNYIDNINETHSIAQRFINVLARQHNEPLVDISELSDLKILKDWRSGLDGVQFSISLSIPNIGTSC